MCFGAICGRGDINLIIKNNIVLYARPESTILLLVFDYFPSRRCANKQRKPANLSLFFIMVSISLLSKHTKAKLLHKSFKKIVRCLFDSSLFMALDENNQKQEGE